MYSYPVELTPDDNGTFMVTFPDVPEAVTFGETEDEAHERAVDALMTALNGYITDRRDIPAASSRAGGRKVAPTLVGALKLAVYSAMRARGWRKADLARALDVNPRQVDRIFDLLHSSNVDQLDAALTACGKMAVIETVDLAA